MILPSDLAGGDCLLAEPGLLARHGLELVEAAGALDTAGLEAAAPCSKTNTYKYKITYWHFPSIRPQ